MKRELGAIFARHVPTQPLSAIVFHFNHGKGVRDGISDTIRASFRNRYTHFILGFHGGTQHTTAPGEAALAQVTE